MAERQRSIGREISLIARTGQCYFDRKLLHLGMGSGQLPILTQLYRRQGCSQEQLAESIGIDKTTLARNIRRLEKEGYVVRKLCEQDHRAYSVRLTEKAQEIGQEVRSILAGWTGLLLAGLSATEINLLYSLLDKVSVNAGRALERCHE